MTLEYRDRLVERFNINRTMVKISRVFFTFHLIAFSWIFFRANSISDAFYVVTKIGYGLLQPSILAIETGKIPLLIPSLLIVFLLAVQFIQRKQDLWQFLDKRNIFIRWSFYYLLIFGIILLGIDESTEFIYFQF